jgi:quercetin dioxygenase-like cupin family protein
MTTRRRIPILTGLVLTGALALYGTAAGDPIGLTGLFNARGTAEPFHIHDHRSHVKLKAGAPVDVAIVGAQLDAHGQTGWHTHPAQSIVSVAPGEAALTMVTQERKRCVTRTYQPGQAFVHPAGPHNFVNGTASPLKFGVAYFVPVGATLLTPATTPKACA